MHYRILAVGDRQPAWVDDAVRHYTARLPAEWRFTVDVLGTAKRGKNDRSGKARDLESELLIARTGDQLLVLLDERGRSLTSPELAARLGDWQLDGRDVCFVIGGPDGVNDALRQRADFVWSLSRLTLPHGLARLICVEQLYRGWSLANHHPYHRA